MPQVSADAHVPVPPAVAAAVAGRLPTPTLRLPPHVFGAAPRWRFDAEDAGTRVVLLCPYSSGPRWFRGISHEPTQWWMGREVQARVDELVDACVGA